MNKKIKADRGDAAKQWTDVKYNAFVFILEVMRSFIHLYAASG
jgi:hypothetical protein